MRIAIVGPESTGKTALAQALATYHACPWVPEYARAYLARLGRPYALHDLAAIACGQQAAEDRLCDPRKPYLFCDTTPLVVQVWSEVKYGHCPAAIADLVQPDRYALHLLTYPDLPWVYDPLRESEGQLLALFDRYHAALDATGLPFAVVCGVGRARLDAALAALSLVAP
ncbi:MAG: hypothetical protein OHK0039_25600 [Bacteroidia bacterium]